MSTRVTRSSAKRLKLNNNQVSSNSLLESDAASSSNESIPLQLQNSISSIVMQNPLILNQVFKYLSVDSLKRVRLVNSVWKTEGNIWLKRKSVVELGVQFPVIRRPFIGFGIRMHLSMFRNRHGKINIPLYMKQMKNFPTQNLQIDLPVMCHRVNTGPDANECFPQLISLMEKIGPGLKYLEIDFLDSDSSNIDPELVQKIFRTLDGLVHIKLNIHCDDDTEKLWREFPVMPKLANSVRRLEMEVFIGDSQKDKTNYEVISDKLLELFPNLTALLIEDAPASFVHLFWNRLKSRGNLTELRLPLDSRISNIEFLPQLSRKSNFLGNLTHLEIALPQVKQPKEIQDLFNRVAPTLTNFRFKVENAFPYGVQPLDEPPSPVLIEMPVFPKLRNLAVTHGWGNCGRWTSTQNVNIKLRFVNDRLDYAVQFPVLRRLTLGDRFICRPFGEFWKFYQVFVPEAGDEQIVPQVLELDVPFLDTDDPTNQKIKGAHLFPLEIMDRLAKCFPNVKNKHLTKSVARLKKVRKYLDSLNSCSRVLRSSIMDMPEDFLS